MARPLSFLDVDGVINPLAPIAGLLVGFALHGMRIAPEPVHQDDRGREPTVALNPAHGAWLRSLATDLDLVWATSWWHRVNEIIAPLLDLTILPVVTPIYIGINRTAKRLPIMDFSRDRPLAWIDDVIERDDWQRARSRRRGRSGIPTPLIATNPSRGMTEAHVGRLSSFARRLRGETTSPGESGVCRD